MKTIEKSIKDLKINDVVFFHGGTFKCIENAREIVETAEYHRDPRTYYQCKAECLTGNAGAYFYPSSSWTFQGIESVKQAVITE